MNNLLVQVSVCVLTASAGSAHAHSEQSPTQLEPTRANVHDAAHIYFNAITGEVVITQLGEHVIGADTGVSGPVWASSIPSACAEYGFGTEWFFGVDDPDSGD